MRGLAPAALPAAALCLLLACWSLAHHTTAQASLITDTGLYQEYGDALAQGAVPYRDFRPEYPPGALPVFVLPSLGHEGDRAAYDRWFDREMAVCWCLALLGVALVLPRRVLPLALVAATPLLLGPVALSRFDAWPAALAVLALAAFVRKRLAVAALLLGAAIGAKLWPVVLLPVLVRRLGARTGAAFTAAVAAVVAAIFIPFALVAPHGLWHSFHQQLARPLQLESLGGALLVAAHHLFGTHVEIVTTYGSQNIAGTAAHVLAVALTVALVAALVTVWARSRDVVAGSAAAVAALLAFGKVFSPQFLLWVVPFAALVPTVEVLPLLVVVLLLTQAYFPRHYWDLAAHLRPNQSFELVVRDLLVVFLFAMLVRAARLSRATAPSPAPAPQPRPE